MAIFSSTSSVSRYFVEDKFDGPVYENIGKGLFKFAIPKIEEELSEISMGWVPRENPYIPDFEKYGFYFGTYFLFCLRIDKKSIPSKLIQKFVAKETEKRMEKSARNFISKNEASEIKEMVTEKLTRQIPSVPNIYDVLWHYDDAVVYLFTTQKTANELFETLFFKSFNIRLTRLFPYTMIQKKSSLSDTRKDILLNQQPFKYSG